MTKLRALLPLGVFAVLAIFFYIGLHRDPSAIDSPLVGKPAPAFSRPSVLDPQQQISNADFAGKPYVLNVWGTWCQGCLEEHEALIAISRRSTVPIIGLVWRDTLEPAQRWLRELGNPYTAVALDDPEGRVAIDWGIYKAPETFLISADGRILHKHPGLMTMAVWEEEFLPRIAGAGQGGK